MREMQDSGIGGLGKIPARWKVVKLYNLLKERTDIYNTKKDGYLPLLSVSEYYGVADRREKIGKNQYLTRAESLDGYKKCKKNDIVSNIMLAWKGALGESPLDGIVSPAYCVYSPSNNINSHYLQYLLRTKAYCDNYRLNSTGIIMSRLRLYSPQFLHLKVIQPSKKEQQSIADFLDAKCVDVDSLTEDIQKQIETLKEYKKSVITQAVTKGLDPNVEMKDSGIEWIGKIAITANIYTLKYETYMKGRIGWQGLKSKDFIDEGPYCVTSTDFTNGKVNWNSCYHVSIDRYNMDPYIQIKVGDLLISKDGTIGKLALIDSLPDKACLNSHLLIIRPLNGKYLTKYLYYVLQSKLFTTYYNLVGSGSTMQSLSQEKLGQFRFPIWGQCIQQSIVDFLDTKCADIDAAIEEKQKQLDVLKEYKKSLIYEYVTGKKEVPCCE